MVRLSYSLFLFLFFLTASQEVQASRIKRGFEALEMMDYFKAKKLLRKGMKYHPSPGAFGLAIIFSRDDNPFYSLDSAYRYVLAADSAWSVLSDKKKTKYKPYINDRSSIDSLKQIVSKGFYLLAKSEHTIEAYTHFIAQNPWAADLERATYTRDSIAFFDAVNENSSAAFEAFMKRYPNSAFYPMAEDNYFNAEYYEWTADRSINSYMTFIEKNPGSPMRRDAEDAVYRLVVEPNTLQAFELFVLGYEENPNIDKAWKAYYQLYISEYSRERILQFLDTYPQCLNRAEVELDLYWMDSLLLPFIENEQYGFMNATGEVVIEPIYDFADTFKQGVAIVGRGGKYGFIQKSGELLIPLAYDNVGDFREGRAVVERDGKMGLIDRNNRLLLPMVYTDLGEMSNGLIYLSKGDRYGYADLNGVLMIPEKFEEAYDFVQGIAKVENNGWVQLINRHGEYVMDRGYEDLTQLSDSLFVCELNGKKGIVTRNGTVVIEPKYDQIGNFSDGLALVAKSDTVEYINYSGEVVVSKGFKIYPNFLSKGEFRNGSAIVFRKNKYGKINSFGTVVTDIEYDNLGIGNGFTPFSLKEKWGLLSPSNKVLISAKYESLDMMNDQFVVVRSNDSLGVLDVNGNVIIPFSYQSILHLKDDLFAVERNQKYGIFKLNRLVVPLEYDRVVLYEPDYVLLSSEGEFQYYLIKNEEVVTLNRRE